VRPRATTGSRAYARLTPQPLSLCMVVVPTICHCTADTEFRLEDWLGEIGVTPSKIAVTARQLRDNDLDDRALLQKITVEELKECGVASVGIRKCIIEAVRSPGPEDASLLSGFKCTFAWGQRLVRALTRTNMHTHAHTNAHKHTPGPLRLASVRRRGRPCCH
jgi:hypothetical protein